MLKTPSDEVFVGAERQANFLYLFDILTGSSSIALMLFDYAGAKMAYRKKIDLSKPGDIRRSRSENQSEFWFRFGVTQSGGSRYESNRAIPKPVKILMALYVSGLVDDQQIAEACKAADVRR